MLQNKNRQGIILVILLKIFHILNGFYRTLNAKNPQIKRSVEASCFRKQRKGCLSIVLYLLIKTFQWILNNVFFVNDSRLFSLFLFSIVLAEKLYPYNSLPFRLNPRPLVLEVTILSTMPQNLPINLLIADDAFLSEIIRWLALLVYSRGN